MAQARLEPFDLNGKLILADKGYDSDKFARWLKERGGIVVIPSRITAKHPKKTDWHTYKERHLVEKLFLKLKNNRRFATRYEKSSLFPRRCLPRLYPPLATLMVLKQSLLLSEKSSASWEKLTMFSQGQGRSAAGRFATPGL